MSVYVIAQISITDRAAYERYQARFFDVFRKFEGELLAADEAPEIVEGEWTGEKVVLMKFPDKVSFERWAYSPAYREIAKDRQAGSEAVVLMVKSFSI
ncbi:MAG TPA: DUF1330 domain-containing protein [Pyrinomonadaceae bacterium]|jgi:uncharacterized protein (DUF1330 family)